MTDFDDKLKILNKNVTSNKPKHLLVENKLNELSKKVKAISTERLTKDLITKISILNGAKYFSSEIFQNYLAFIPDEKYIKYFNDTTRIDLWKSNGMSEVNIENITKSDSNFAPTFLDHYLLPDISSNGHCLIKNNISIPKKIIHLYISYKLNPQLKNLSKEFILNNCLFRSVKPTEDADPNKYKYSDYGIGFNSCSEFSFTEKNLEKTSLVLELI